MRQEWFRCRSVSPVRENVRIHGVRALPHTSKECGRASRWDPCMVPDEDDLPLIDDSATWDGTDFASARVLLVDDMATNLFVLRRVVESLGISHVECITDATLAVEACRRF